MSRAFDMTLVVVIIMISLVVHIIGLELFSVGAPLYEVATDGTANLGGQAKADLWRKVLTVWVPVISMAGIMAWAIAREYRRQAVTAVRAP